MGGRSRREPSSSIEVYYDVEFGFSYFNLSSSSSGFSTKLFNKSSNRQMQEKAKVREGQEKCYFWPHCWVLEKYTKPVFQGLDKLNLL